MADSIDAEKVQALKKQYPDYAFICYINTSAEVKALCDCCVTSSNVYKIVETYPNDKIYFLPDELMGKNVEAYLNEKGVKKEFKYYSGTCYVHEEYDPDMIDYIQLNHPEAAIVAHPECKPSITAKADYVGSTSQMVNFVKETKHDSHHADRMWPNLSTPNGSPGKTIYWQLHRVQVHEIKPAGTNSRPIDLTQQRIRNPARRYNNCC